MKITEKLLLKYHQGECSPAEKVAVQQWLEEEEETENILPSNQEDEVVAAIWKNLSSHISPAKPESKPIQIPWLRWAASVALICCIGVTLYSGLLNSLFSTNTTFEVAEGKQGNVILADQTSIALNSGSSITYPSRFSFFSRKMEMGHGEAFFHIAKDPKRPFILSVGEAKIEVLGTKFNVSNHAGKNRVTVTLTEGSISFSASGREQLLLPGQQLVYHKETGQIELIQQIDTERITAWTQDTLWFEDTPIQEVLEVISRRFAVRFINRGYEERSFTGKFKQENLNEIIQLLSKTTNLSFSREKAGIAVQNNQAQKSSK
ncbi:FecR family protein [Algoriphagus sp. Y33]|uniref:FecR family protein n=1 Tax=Algoriphagus sp. Y33 TaxID=2772483 RepID=UPI00178027C3|nr:FecR family protein [Algoriphagus sp. Y33]